MATWDDEKVGLVKDLWAKGLSASTIANMIGGVSRNAVIGKVHRLGLAERSKNINRTRHPKPTSGKRSVFGHMRELSPKEKFLARLKREAVDEASRALSHPFIPVAERKLIEDLEEPDCRWPIGDKTPFQFCARKKVAGISYCEAHAKLAINPVQPKPRPFTFANTGRPLGGAQSAPMDVTKALDALEEVS